MATFSALACILCCNIYHTTSCIKCACYGNGNFYQVHNRVVVNLTWQTQEVTCWLIAVLKWIKHVRDAPHTQYNDIFREDTDYFVTEMGVIKLKIFPPSVKMGAQKHFGPLGL